MNGVDYDIRGAEGLALVGRAVRSLGADRTIVNEMAKEIRAAVPPVRAAVRANAIAYLPHRGGFGRWVAKARLTAKIRRSAANAGVTFVDGRNSASKRTDLKRINAGSTRHQTFGGPPWHPQTVRAGFFDDAVTEEGADAFRAAVVVAVDRAAGRILGG